MILMKLKKKIKIRTEMKIMEIKKMKIIIKKMKKKKIMK